VWKEKYGSFNKKEEVEKIIQDKSWLFIKFIEENCFPYREIKNGKSENNGSFISCIRKLRGS